MTVFNLSTSTRFYAAVVADSSVFEVDTDMDLALLNPEKESIRVVTAQTGRNSSLPPSKAGSTVPASNLVGQVPTAAKSRPCARKTIGSSLKPQKDSKAGLEAGESRQDVGDMQEKDDSVPKQTPEPEPSGTNAERLDAPSSSETSDSDKVYDRTRGRGRPRRIHVHASLTESAA